GRMTSETNPESGTTYYYYDSDTDPDHAYCSAAAGELVRRTDAVGNATCYAHDAAGRVTGVTYPAGSYAGVTPEKHFVYGGGHLTEAYTGPSGSKTTDLGFSYDALGRPTGLSESTPHSGGTYTVGAAYEENGALKTLSGAFPTITYGVDGEGRVATVSDPSGTGAAVSGTSYNTAGQVTGVTLGSGDSDSYTYNADTGRMAQYQFTVNGTTDTGALSWNSNGSLGELHITDGLSGTSDSRDCTYLHDDLRRLAKTTCGTDVWTYAPDLFGNLKTSGPTSFAASFSTAHNQISEVGSFVPHYDADGNLEDDPISEATGVYGWDAEGKLATAGGTALTRDALGRVAESYDGSSYTEYVYGPKGSKLEWMNGGTLKQAAVPLPGGGTAVYTGSSGPPAEYWHADGLGSVRLDSSASRTVVGSEAYTAFGGGLDASGSAPADFTGQFEDTVTGTSALYDFQQRELSPTQGRWLSPDPAGMAAVDPSDPQSWDRYAYVGGTPLEAVDPLGLKKDCTTKNPCPTFVANVWAPKGGGIDTMEWAFYQMIAWLAGGNRGSSSSSSASGGNQNQPTPNNTRNCKTGFGIGLTAGADATAGLGYGAGANGSVGAGVFAGNGLNAGGFASGGAAASAFGHGASIPGANL